MGDRPAGGRITAAGIVQSVGVDSDAPGAQGPGGLQGAGQKGQVVRPLAGVDEGEGAVPVAAADGDAGPVRRGPEGRQIPALPAPELYGVKAVVPGGLKPFRKRQFLIHRIQMGGSKQRHGGPP